MLPNCVAMFPDGPGQAAPRWLRVGDKEGRQTFRLKSAFSRPDMMGYWYLDVGVCVGFFCCDCRYRDRGWRIGRNEVLASWSRPRRLSRRLDPW